MRKLLIGALIVCLSLLGLTAMAAAEFSWSGAVSFGITGASDGASGVLNAGAGGIDVEATATSGPWTGTVGFEDFALDDATLVYGADAFDLTMNPVGIDSGLYDIATAADVTLGIPSNPGMKLDLPTGGVDIFAVVNNSADAADELVWNFAGGADFSMDALGLGLVYNSDQENATNSYAAQVTYSVSDIDLIGQYGSYTPDGGDAGAGYYVEAGYTLAEGTVLTVSYAGADATLNSADGTARDTFAEIYGEVVVTLADNVELTIDVTSTDDGSGVDSVTAWEALVELSI